MIETIIEETATCPIPFFKEKMQEIKEDQKARALRIRVMKSTRKSVPHGFVSGLASEQAEYRHFHIAYSELRGRKREQIERTCDEHPVEPWIQRIKDHVTSGVKVRFGS